uniref:Acyltransferase 3 domain-containing protein n=1 Tax=Heliothis virescens TaxID=7102 RepID=A0A2A4JF89_HELVI
MPPLFHLDNYEECFDDPEELYCTLDLTLVSEEPSPLLTMIQEYSEKPSTHFNHTILNQGICIKKTCKEFYEPNKDLRLTLEACLNESLYNKHKLKARVSNGFDCSKREKHPPVDYIDLTIGIICLIILMLNLIGSLCDSHLDRRKMPAVFRFVYHFSIFRSWKKLVASPSRDDRLLGLKGLHGIRTINVSLVITCHSLVTGVFLTVNPQYIEELLNDTGIHIILNGTLIMQTFFITSSFLLVYMFLIKSEGQEPSWKLLPMIVIRRWLRYLAADTQLYCMGAIIFLLCRSGLSRKIMLSLLFVVGMIIPALHTYYQDLDGIMMITPPMALTFFVNNPMFDNIYKRGHTNITGYIVGMAIGYIFYDWQKTGGDYKKFQKYRYVYWCLIPLCVLCCYSGSIYFSDRPRLPTYVNVLYALLLKPVFCILMGLIIVGIVNRFEGLCSSILEWRPWTLLSRLSFCAYLMHVAIIRNTIAMQTTTQMTTIPNNFLQCAKIQLGSFIFAFFLHILVEAPFGSLIQAIFTKFQTRAQDVKETDTTKIEDVKSPSKTYVPMNMEALTKL